jgi:hypothetical protein
LRRYWHQYKNDPDYLGTLTQMDAGIGVIRSALAARGMSDSTVIFFTTDVSCCPASFSRAGVPFFSIYCLKKINCTFV